MWPRCSSPPRPIIATSRSATRSTSPIRPSRHWTSGAGRRSWRRRCAAVPCGASRRAAGRRRATPGGIRCISSRCWKPRSAARSGLWPRRALNAARAPVRAPGSDGARPAELLAGLLPLLDRQQQVNEAGALVAAYLAAGGDDARLLATLGKALLREDRDFHTIQTTEIAFHQYALLRGTPAAAHMLIAAARYLAAHAPTARAQGQTYSIALRLHRGERIYEG